MEARKTVWVCARKLAKSRFKMTVSSPTAWSVYQNDLAETVGSYRSSEEGNKGK